jgi:hypothetical protein
VRVSLSGETIDDDQLLIRYLLGSLDEDETERLDELSIADDDFAWRLRAAENDIVDAYVRGDLSGETLDRFRSSYLSSPARREKVEFARALLTFTGRQSAPRTRGWFSIPLVIPRWAFGCGAAAAAIAAGFLIYNQRQLQIQVSQLQASHSELQQRERELRNELSEVSSPGTRRATEQPAGAIATLAVLLPPPTRSAAHVPVVKLSPSAPRVGVGLQLEADDFPLYRVTLKDAASGRIIWRSGDMKSHAPGGHTLVTIAVPAGLLKSGRYLAELSSAGARSESIANYPFDVLEK